MRGGAASSAIAIPPQHRKLVQNVKEVAPGHGDEEIFAMLNECNMDPDETAQRLMSQDTFHEVKRKKDRKKEGNSMNKESSEGRSRGSGSYRGGRGGGRGVARYVSSETNGRGKFGAPRENGNHTQVPTLAADTKPAPPPPQVQLAPQGSVLSSGSGLSNGSLHYQTSGTTVSWSKIAGHATMAEMLKSQQSAIGSMQMPKLQRQPAPEQQMPPQQQQFPSSGMYSSGDPVHHPFTSSSVIKREIGIVGIQRSFGDRGGLPSPPSQASSSQDDLRPVSPPQESIKGQDPSSTEALRPRSATAVGNGRPAYQPPVVGNKPAGISLEWKTKLVEQDDDAGVESVVSEALKFPEPELLSVSTKFQSLSARDEPQHVIMPSNFQSQGDLGLSFGSFGESFGSSIPSGFRSDEPIEAPASPEASVPAKDILHDEPSDGGDIVQQDDPVHHQEEMPAQRDSLASNSAASIPSATYNSSADISKLRAQQQVQLQSYLQSTQSYSSGGIGMVSQIPGSHYDSQESHLQDLPSAPSTLKQQHYQDSAASYYSPAFRPSSEDARYAQYLPTNTAAAKYGNGAVVMASQQHLPAHEVSTSSSVSSASTASQVSNTHSMPTAAQQPVPVHAYPAQPTGVPVGHFGNVFGYHQYPSYTFMSPYHHQHAGYTANYPQPPVSSYSPAATGNYSPAAAAAVAAAAAAGAVKYTTLPQYKPGSATANAPISSVSAAYGGYGAASSMYGANPSGTAGSTPGYEESSQYKESNLYMHGPQGDGARLWNDVTGQTSSFYTLSGQSQHSSYPQQASGHTHPMASYTSLYHHPSQQQQPGGPAAAASGHQMMQQPQALSGAAGSTQVGAATYHQQLQRMQQQPSWNTY